MSEIKYLSDDSLLQVAVEVKNRIPTKLSELENDTDFSASFYGECSTATSTTDKVVSIANFTADNLVKGVCVRVKFSNPASTTSVSKLNVSSTGAKPIQKYGSTSAQSGWVAGQVITFVYDGNYWQMVDYQQNTDANVKQTANNTSANYCLLFKGDTTTSEKTQGTYFNSNVTVQPSTATLTASKFVGDGSGLTNLPGDSTKLPLAGGTLTGNLTAPYYWSTNSYVNKLPTDDSGTSYNIIRHVKNASNTNEMLHNYRNDATSNVAVYKVRLYNPSDHTTYVDFDFTNDKGTPKLIVGNSQIAVIKSISMTQTTGTSGVFYLFGNNNTYNSKKVLSVEPTSANAKGYVFVPSKNDSGQWTAYVHSLVDYSATLVSKSISYTVYYMD